MAPSNKKSTIRVLHVDDDLCFLEVSKQIISMENNFEIDNAASVDEAFKKMEQQPYDAIVSDYEMPQKNGLEFLKELREKNNQIPFVLFTGKGREEVVVKALNLGADSYINKNGSPETIYCELADAINKTIERKKSKKALAESELKYRTVVEKSLQGILITQTSPLRLVFANESMGNILGYSTEELKSLSPEGIAGLIYNEDRTVFFKRLESRMLGEPAPSNLEFRAVRKNGSIVWLEAFANRIDYMGQPAVQGMFLDISERKKVDQILRENEARYRELADSLPDIVFEIDLNGKFTFLNQRAFEITGYTKEEFEKGLNIFQLAASEDRQRGLENMQKSLTGKSHTPTEYTITRKNGTTFTGLIRASQRISENKVIGLRAIVIDITERKKNDLEIKQKNEALERVAESIDSGLAVIDRDYSVVWANKYLMDLGVAPNKKCYQTFNSSETVCPDCGAKKVFEQNASLDVREFKTVNSKGETVWIELRVTPLKDKDGNVTAALELAVPITERKKAEEKIAWLASFPMLNPNPVLEVSFEGNISYLNSATESIFPDLKKAGLSHPLFSGWNDLLATFRNKKMQTLGRNIKINDNWFHQQFNVHIETQKVRIYVTNITEAKLAEKTLLENEAKFKIYMENSPVAVFVANTEGKYEYVNEAASELLGYSTKELMGMSIQQVTFDGEPKAFSEVKNTGRSTIETVLRSKDGLPVFVILNSVKLPDDKLMAFCENITERKLMQCALQESEEKFRTITNSVRDAIILVNDQAKVAYWNPAAEKIFGYSNKEAIGKDIHQLVVPPTVSKIGRECIENGVKTFTETGEGNFTAGNVELVGLRKNGSEFPAKLSLSSVNLGGKWSAVGVVKDITERKQTEQKLRDAEKRYHTLFSQTPLGVLIIDPKTEKAVEFNGVAHTQLGYSREEFSRLRISDFEAKKTEDEINAQITKILTTGGDEFETKHRAKNGEVRDVIVTVKVMELDGRSFLDCVFHDITEIKKMQNALMESETQYRQLVSAVQEGIWALDSNYQTVFVNPRMAKLLGYAESEMVGKTLLEFLNKKCVDRSKQVLGQFKQGVKEHFDCEIGRKNGSVICVSIAVSVIKDDEGKPLGTLLMVSDITDRKVLEAKVDNYSKHLKSMVELRTAQLKDANERLVKSERLAAIGELAGMVGHDLRNPLAGIKNAAYFLKKKGTTISEAQSKEMLEIIDKAIDHSDKIINDLLDYAREMHLELTKYGARTLVEEATRTIQVPDRIQIVNHVHEEAWIWVNADKMMRVFINLIKNAVDAMPEKGTLEISSCQTKDSVEIAFADTGTGIPKETLQKIFTPLFTTKAQGMGFGLAICKRIIEAHGGTITVETAVNKGTTFTITLPLKPKVKVEGEKTWVTMPESMSMMMKTKT